ncbi:CTP synthase (glutamine hydrolyzing) [Candidatus Woesearchaeota archaeon]|nr:CTP synthase (glutamine hydrolyzing) [Candidatus Woesearchaeota archaeon]
MPKFIIVTGGVLSGLGKGIAAASIGFLLDKKLKIVPIKCDGYLNTDPGTMNPIEHGEVFVLDDGGEVDMDFGHYERFLRVTCKSDWNNTMGKVFHQIYEKERLGDFLGKTVQFIPHVTDQIKQNFFDVAETEKADVVLVEVGGTVGDIENELYLEAVRQLKHDIGVENIMYVHLTYVPVPYNVHEQKSKPTQQSVNLLRQRGIKPDVIIGRCQEQLNDKIKEKIAQFCDIKKEAVISGRDVSNVYNIPLVFYEEGITKIIEEKLGIKTKKEQDLAEWKTLVENGRTKTIKIALAGKYTKLEDSYASVIEAINHSAAKAKVKAEVVWIETSEDNKVEELLEGIHAVIVPGGFGSRGTEGKIDVINYCREKKVPFLGLCYGLQLAVVEFARNTCGLHDANTTEVNPETKHPVVDILPEQKDIIAKGGTMRLGAYPADIKPGTLTHKMYGKDRISERHRHRYEVNPEYHEILLKKGMIFSGMSPNKKLVEFIELPDHPYFIATQAHPELKSNPKKPAPLFQGLIDAAVKMK